MAEMMNDLIQILRKTNPEQIAQDLLSIQPIPGSLSRVMFENSMREDELVREGYSPACPITKLLWVKPHV